jgi:glucosylceramidase
MHAPTPIRVIQTAQGTADRLAELAPLEFGPVPDYTVQWIMVDPDHGFQTLDGFGGAFTEAAAVTLQKLSPSVQEEALRAYFDPARGHGYTLCRTHINSCDFALGNYAYAEVPGDVALQHFSIERDRRALIPMIRRALQVSGGGLRILASPWSPPAWMKSTGRMNAGGTLKPEYRAAWARYFCRYIRAYEAEGIPLWGVTVQNEPLTVSKWDNCNWTPEEERDFVRDDLGPALQREGLARVKLLVWDQNRNRIYERAKAIYEDAEAARYVWGAGFHWYAGDHFENLEFVHDVWPEKHLLFTEGCVEGGPHLGEWEPAERYARSIIRDLNGWAVGWVDWNLLLDDTGGPNHAGNFCHAPVMADTRDGRLLFQPAYYYLGHFARFIRPGARRVVSSSTLDELETTAFLNPDGTLAVVVLNRTDAARGFTLRCRQRGARTECPPHAIRTFCFAAPAKE